MLEVTRVPNSPEYVDGVINLRGVGFVVDAVSEVLRIPKSVTEAPPPIVAGVNAEYITAVGKLEDRLLILLDLEEVLSEGETDNAVRVA